MQVSECDVIQTDTSRALYSFMVQSYPFTNWLSVQDSVHRLFVSLLLLVGYLYLS